MRTPANPNSFQHHPFAMQLMQRAVQLSFEGMKAGHGGPFGAVIARTTNDEIEIIGEGFNRVLTSNDPTAHAEVLAIREACQKVGDFRLQGFTLFSSCEPCPMCFSACYWSRLDAVYFGNTREDAAVIGFDDAAIYQEVGKSVSEREKLPTIHLPDSAARTAFDTWQALPDKQEY